MSAQNYDAVVAGLACLDIAPIFNNPPATRVEDVLVPFQTTVVGKSDIHIGGCISNTGIAMHKFGIHTKLMSMIGDDDFGSIVKSQYMQFADDTGLKIKKNADTPYSIVLAPRGVDRMFLFHSGCSGEYGFDDIDFDIVSGAKLFHFGYPQALRKTYENDGEELYKIMKQAHDIGACTSLDTSDMDEHSLAGRSNWCKILEKVIPYVDIFAPSVDELCYMIDRPTFKRWEEKSNITKDLLISDVKPLAD